MRAFIYVLTLLSFLMTGISFGAGMTDGKGIGPFTWLVLVIVIANAVYSWRNALRDGP